MKCIHVLLAHGTPIDHVLFGNDFRISIEFFLFLLGKVASVVDIGAGVGQLGAWLLKNVRYT